MKMRYQIAWAQSGTRSRRDIEPETCIPGVVGGPLQPFDLVSVRCIAARQTGLSLRAQNRGLCELIDTD